MPSQIPAQFKTYVAWKFNNVLPGAFTRDRQEFKGIEYPIIAPLPTHKRKTPALESSRLSGPYIYFVTDDQAQVRYVGKSEEKLVLHRWVRPGYGGPTTHYWTHAIKSGGCIVNIANGLKGGHSREYTLRYVPVREIPAEVFDELGLTHMTYPTSSLEDIEMALARLVRADWNKR